MKNTVARGSEAELLVALIATQQGFAVSTPITHHSEYDLIIDTGTRLNRVQVKRAYEVNNHGSKVLCVETRRILVKHSGQKGSVASSYSNNGYDFLIAVDCKNRSCWVIPREETKRFKAQIYLGGKMQPYFEQWNVLGDVVNQQSETVV
jgi:hypothetical protein